MAKTYKVLTGISIPDPANKGQELEYKAGDKVELPDATAKWMKECGAVEEVEANA